MKILLVNNRHFHGGGADVVYFNTAEMLKANGHEIVFFSRLSPESEPCEYEDYFDKSKVHSNPLQKITRYCYNDSAAKSLQSLIDKEHLDLAHIHLMWGGLTASILDVLRRNNIPVVHTVHDYRMVCPAYTFKNNKGQVCEKCGKWGFFHCTLGRCSKGKIFESGLMTIEMYYRNLFHNPLNTIDGFIFVSHFSERKHLEHNPAFGQANRTVLYNFTKPVLAPSVSNKNKEDYILYYGRLSYEKGIPTLIHAIGSMPHCRLRVVGTGPLEDELKKHCSDSGYKNIEFVGYKSGEMLFELVKNARFVCVPSECYENNPMTIVESYSLGTPVIGARIGGIPEIIEEGATGYTFESGNERDLVQALFKALDLSSEKYSAMCINAYNFYKANFGEEVHYTRLMDFYSSVLNKK